MKELNLPTYSFKIKSKEQKKYIFDSIRRKFILLTPEEWVRQNFIQYLSEEKGYPQSLMSVEHYLKVKQISFRADIAVFNRKGDPVLIVECKAPEVPVSQDHFDQISRYNIHFRVNYLIVTNGISHYCNYYDFAESNATFLKYIPAYEDLPG
jgi:hypothetical protein